MEHLTRLQQQQEVGQGTAQGLGRLPDAAVGGEAQQGSPCT